MAEQKKYLDYEGLQRLVQNLNNKYAPIKALVFKLSVEDVAHLPALNTVRPGWMYNIEEEDVTTADFVEGAGHAIQVGENVAAVELFTGEYTEVAAPVITDDPKVLGWYEVDTVTYNDITVSLDPDHDNPQDLGLYEYDTVSAEYILTTDTSVVNGKHYFEKVTTYELSQDRIPVQDKDYFTANTVMKWDTLGGIFDLEDKYLEFGIEFPKNPVDGRTFLYMGEDTKVYTVVETPTGRPSDNKYYEGVFTEVDPVARPINNPKQENLYELIENAGKYIELSPVGNENPKALGWYESNGSGGYQLTEDETVDPGSTGKKYYEKVSAYALSEDIEYNDEKTYYTGVFTLSVDNVVDPTKYYYSEADQYNHAVIYVYDETEEDWVPQTSSGSGDMVPITAQEIDDLFI